MLSKIEIEKEELVQAGKLRKEREISVNKNNELLKEIPESWQWVKLKGVCLIVTDGDHLAPPQAEVGIPLLVIGNIRNGFLDFSDTRCVLEEYFNLLGKSRIPVKGDIFYTLVGSYSILVLVDADKPCATSYLNY